jgi:hypothetical protein
MISVKGIEPKLRHFHNVSINVYETTLKLEKIKYWRGNDRTLLKFELIERAYKKQIAQISIKEIVEFLIKQRELEIERLAESIKNNDVKVPLIVLNDGKLLDGNRRYFACYYLKMQAEQKSIQRPNVLDHIPVWIIKNADVNEIDELKILAESNFVYPNKVDWPDDVKAKVVSTYYDKCIKSGMSDNDALNSIVEVYSIDKQRARDYLKALELTKEFIKTAKNEDENYSFREIVQEKFVYFWEFINKSKVLEKSDVREVKKLFFIMVKNRQLKNIKLIEPLIWAKNDPDDWALLVDSKGSKITQIEALYKEEKAIKSAEDKIQNFIRWLTRKIDSKSFTSDAYELLAKLGRLLEKIISKRK